MAYHLPWLHMEQASMSTVESCRRMSGIVSNNKYMQIQSQICKFQDIYICIYICHNKYIYKSYIICIHMSGRQIIYHTYIHIVYKMQL